MNHSKTPRGFRICTFKDLSGNACSIQESSLATENAIWFGCDDIGLKKFEPGGGWSNVKLEQNFPHGVSHIANTRMQLDQKTVRMLLPILQHFADTGELPEIEDLKTEEQEYAQCIAELEALGVSINEGSGGNIDAVKGALEGWTILPAPEGTCPVCATQHDPEDAHNAQSLFYQYTFFGAHDRWPTWEDAMSHCTEDRKKMWREELTLRGIDVANGKIYKDQP